MNKQKQFFLSLIFRYTILILLGVFFIFIFSKLFTFLTIHPLYFLLNIFYNVSRNAETFFINSSIIKIISACVAPSAYYLLLILNLATPKINFSKRIKILLFSFILFFIINLLRIFFLSILYVSGSTWFDFTHKFLWYLFSIVFVVGIWFFLVWFFKIKQIPFYSDLKLLYKILFK